MNVSQRMNLSVGKGTKGITLLYKFKLCKIEAFLGYA